MSETKTQWFVLYGGLFIPIVDNVVRDGAYIVDDATISDRLFYSLWQPLKRVNTDAMGLATGGGYRMAIPAEDCIMLLQVVSSTEAELEVSVTLST